jgi:flagellar M-ring protein FliF
MPEIRKAIEQATRFWQELNGKQRLLLAGGGVLTVAVLLLFVRQLATPSYKVLLSGLTPADAQSIATQLAGKNIPHQFDQSGTTLSVPADQLDVARLEVASQGIPRSGRLGFEIFDKASWGQTEFDEKVNYQRALEGELERTIQELRDVETARVHLVLPSESVFIDRQRVAKASVILKLKRGALSGEAQLSIARLVAGAVDSLDPNNVAVIDADTNRPLGQPQSDPTGSSLEEQLSRRLLSTLAPILGPDHVRASVNVEFDPSTTDESEERYDPASTVTLSMQRSEERIGGTATGGVVGTSSNVPGAKVEAHSGSSGEDGTQNTKSEVANYGVNKTVRHSSKPAGRIRRITAALLVDDTIVAKNTDGKITYERKKWSEDELKRVRELAEATLGLDPTRGDLVSVQNITFEQPTPQAVPPIPRLERIRTVLSQWSRLLRYLGIVLLFLATYALVIRPIKSQALATMKELPARATHASSVGAFQGSSPALTGDGLLALGQPQKAQMLKQQVLEKVKHEPQSSSRLVQAWLREE